MENSQLKMGNSQGKKENSKEWDKTVKGIWETVKER